MVGDPASCLSCFPLLAPQSSVVPRPVVPPAPESEPSPRPPGVPGGARGVATGAFNRTLGTYRPTRVPAISRRNYARELTAAFFLPFVLAVFEGSVISVLVRLAFEGQPGVPPRLLNYVVGTLAIIPALANITSFVWVKLSHGVDKVRFIVTLQGVVIAMAIVIAFAPRSLVGLFMIVAAVFTAKACWAGILSVRSTVWKLNYPQARRASLTGKFATVQVTMIAILSLGLGMAMDADPRAFRVLLPVGAVLAFCGVWQWRKVRVRTHRKLLRRERAADALNAPSFNPAKLLGVVRHDRAYDMFMASQFLLGLGNIMASSLLAITLRERFEANYLLSLLLSTALPLVMMPVTIPLWARLLDRTHIVHFRAIHSWVFVAALACLFLGSRLGVLPLLIGYSVFTGIAFGGGVLAWTLGHLDFAPRHKESLYGGVHVTLTGVRGLLAGVAGVTLYEGLETLERGAGSYVFAGCLALAAGGALGFVVMSRRMHALGIRTRAERTGEVDPPGRANA